MMSKIAGVAAALAIGAEAAPRMYNCPTNYSPMPNFDMDRYMGQWYEIVRDKYIPFELLASCVGARYTTQPDGNVEVFNTALTP